MREEIPPEEKTKLRTNLPDIDSVLDYLELIPLDSVALQSRSNANVYISIICLQEACFVVEETIFALEEAQSNLVWYRKYHPDAPVEYLARFYGKYYADDIALRLHSAAEHAANFIVHFLEISGTDLKQFRKKENTTQAARVGNYMTKQMPKHPVTTMLQELMRNPSWNNAISYRNDWVHNQPQLIEAWS